LQLNMRKKISLPKPFWVCLGGSEHVLALVLIPGHMHAWMRLVRTPIELQTT
jgi:hypothetical protein